MNGIEIMRQSVKVHGATKQRNKAIEEMGELTTALMQERDGRILADAVITEIADVCITAYELALIYGLEKVEAEINRKLERLRQRIADKTAPNDIKESDKE